MESPESQPDLWAYLKDLKDHEPDWRAVQSEWLTALDALLVQMDAWLEPGKAAGLLETERTIVQIAHDPDLAATYDAPSLRIRFPPRPRQSTKQLVEVLPYARIVLGALGRVDITSMSSSVMLLRVAPPPGIWKVARRTPQLVLSTFDEKTFQEILLQMIRI